MGAEVNSAGGAMVQVPRRCIVTVALALKRLTRPIKGYGAHPWHRGFPWIDEPRRLAIAAAAVVAIFVFGMILLDAAATNSVRYLAHGVVSFFDWITDFGKAAWVLWPLGVLFLILAALPRNLSPMSHAVVMALMVRVGFLFVAVSLPGLFASFIKNVIGRARPGVGGSVNPYLFDPFHWTPAWAGLPSGHTTAAFAILAAFATLFPRARTYLLIYALLIAVSRIVVRAHYPTDAAAGALVGIVGVLLIRRWFALQRLGFSILPDGTLAQYPGLSLRRIKSVARELLA
jgi:undecaprenyl-diphosphatase